MRWLIDKIQRSQSSPARGVVLLYHRIARGQVDPYALCVSPEHFEHQMRILAERFNPVSLDAFAKHLADKTLQPRSVAVTFDDGYVDNFEAAGPILARHDINASVFMVTGSGGRTQEFWWDELERIFLQPGDLPARLELWHAGEVSAWDLGEASRYTQEQATRFADWKIPWADVPEEQAKTPTQRHKVFRGVYLMMQPMTAEEQANTLGTLRDWAGIERVVRPTHRAVALDKLAETIHNLPISIGAHTIDHAALTSMGPAQQRRQLSESRSAIEDCLGKPITTASYPYGLYNRDTLRVVRKLGFDAAFVCKDLPVANTSKRFEIPRLQVPDIDGDAFETLLNQTLGINTKVGC